MRRARIGVYRESAFETIRESFAPAIVVVAAVALVAMGLRGAEVSSRAEGRRLLEESLRRAALRCYVTEGSYPKNLEHIEKHYGVYIDRARYAAFYEIFAPNIFPDITVTETGGGVPR
jgi:hypothetical protein